MSYGLYILSNGIFVLVYRHENKNEWRGTKKFDYTLYVSLSIKENLYYETHFKKIRYVGEIGQSFYYFVHCEQQNGGSICKI